MKKRALSKGEKLLIAAILLVVIVGAAGYFFYSINVNPVVSIPTPAMPEPNALDVYLTAQKLTVPSIPVPAGPNPNLTIDDVRECIKAGKIGPNPKWEAGFAAPKLADMRALMAKNAPVLAKARQGFTAEYHDIPMRSFNQSLSHLVRMRDLSLIMLADGKVKCAGGDWDSGTECYLDAMRLGNDNARGGVIISMLVGVALQSIGRSEAWYTLDHVSGAEARRAARRLEVMAAQRVPYADTLREEKWYVQALWLEMFKDPNWRQSSDPKVVAIIADMEVSRYEMLELRFMSKRRVMRSFTRYMDALIENSKEPYPANLKSPPTPDDFPNRILAPAYGDGKAWFRYAFNDAQNGLLTLSFALRAYHAGHGKYPADLQALAPVYLKEIPADPFTAKGTLRYKVTGMSYVLYSVGPDGKDDGGTPSADGQAGATGRNISLRIDSMGDIVAGVNIR